MPFRLTRQFINLMLPMRETGVMYSVMVHSLRAFRAQPDLLTTTMDVFVKEPSFDWKVGLLLNSVTFITASSTCRPLLYDGKASRCVY